MSDPIKSVSARDYLWVDQPFDRDDFRETVVRSADDAKYGVCRNPTTVIGGALCGDDTAVSNACRRAKPGTFDEMLCDDPALRRSQDWFVGVAKQVAELLLGARLTKLK